MYLPLTDTEGTVVAADVSPPRYMPIFNRVQVGWYADDGETFHTVSACLLDINQQGMILVTSNANAFPVGADLWVSVTHPTLTDWVSAKVQTIHPAGQCSQKLTLQFEELCPYDFFKAAVSGAPIGLNAEPR